MSPGWPFLLLLLDQVGAREPACPPDAEIRQILGVHDTQPIACRVGTASVLMGAVVPPVGAGGRPHVVVALDTGNATRLGEADLAGNGREGLPTTADKWTIAVSQANIRGADWLRVDVTAAKGEDLFAAQTVVSFFRGDGRALRHLWTGLGDRHENRFDVCLLDTVAHFELSDGEALVRTRRTTRAFLERTDVAADTLSTARAECVAAAPVRDSIVVADDGVDADVPISKALRIGARENRRLMLRARRSPEDLGLFITHSLGLLGQLENEVMDAPLADPEVAAANITLSGAGAYRMDSGGRSGLNWGSIISVAGPRERALASALEDLRYDEGAWVSPRTDYGGCHQPEQATRALRRFVRAWNAAPRAVREAFAPVVAKDLGEMTTDACFCDRPDQRAKIQRALDRNAALLEHLVGPGPDAAAALRALLSDDGVSFNCSPG